MLLVVAMFLDVCPNSWSLIGLPKSWLSAVLNRVGLWQGDWSMFAPDPETDNGWISAELVDAEQTSSSWNSPIWSEVDSWGKFYRFRHINFYNRLPQNVNLLAWGDFADYLARDAEHRTHVRIAKISLYRNHLNLLRPEDGSLPSRDEEMWTTSSEFLTQRIYQP